MSAMLSRPHDRELERIALLAWAGEGAAFCALSQSCRRALAAVRALGSGAVSVRIGPAGYAVSVADSDPAIAALDGFGPAFRALPPIDAAPWSLSVGARGDGTVFVNREAIPDSLRSVCLGDGAFDFVSGLAAAAGATELVGCTDRADAPLMTRRTLWFRCAAGKGALDIAAALGGERLGLATIGHILRGREFELGLPAGSEQRGPARFRLAVAAGELHSELVRPDDGGVVGRVLAAFAGAGADAPLAVELVAGRSPGVGLRVRAPSATVDRLPVISPRAPLDPTALLAYAGDIEGRPADRASFVSALYAGKLDTRLGADDGDELRAHAALFARAMTAASAAHTVAEWMLAPPATARPMPRIVAKNRQDRPMWPGRHNT